MLRTLKEFESKYEIGNDAYLTTNALVHELHAEREWITPGPRLIGHAGNDLIGMHDSNVVAIACGSIETNLEIDYFELVLDE